MPVHLALHTPAGARHDPRHTPITSSGIPPITAHHAIEEGLLARLRSRFGTRAVGIAAALALEALLILMLLTLGRNTFAPESSDAQISTFDVSAPPDTPQSEPEAERAQQETDTVRPPVEVEPQPQPDAPPALDLPQRARPAPALELPSDNSLNDFNLSDLPRRRPDRTEQSSSAPAYGPSAPPSSASDTEVVGTAPDGSPLYAARWFREPTEQQMRGYLSTARPGSYALIACKTAPGWRVEDCVGVEEYPKGSNLQRAVLAAAWQFEVRPPRRGNTSLVGSWVRIRIDYRRGNASSF